MGRVTSGLTRRADLESGARVVTGSHKPRCLQNHATQRQSHPPWPRRPRQAHVLPRCPVRPRFLGFGTQQQAGAMGSHRVGAGRGLFGTLVVAVAGILLTWATFELALLPILRPTRRAIRKSLDSDADEEVVRKVEGGDRDAEDKETEELEVGVAPGKDEL